MSDIMTTVTLPGEGSGNGRADYGRKTRAEMISQIRDGAAHELGVAQRILAAHDDEFIVKIVRGVHVQHFIEELKP